MRNGTLACVAAATALIAVAAPSLALDSNTPTWLPRETVSSRAYYLYHTGADRALACDHYGNAAVAFYDGVSQDLKYAEHISAGGWPYMTVDTVGTNTGLYPSLAFDRYERPGISYYEFTPDLDLMYAHYDGSAWQKTVVDSNGSVGYDTSLAYDLYGRPAIAYSDSSNYLKLAYDDDGDGVFTVQTITPDGRYPTLAFDSQNRPRIAYRRTSTNTVTLATQGKGAWVLHLLPYTTTDAPSMAIDPDTGDPALAFVRSTDGDLLYVEWDEYHWTSSVVDTGNTDAPSLAFDPADGHPAIAYDEDNDLRFAWFDGSVWHTQTVDATAGENPSLAFNEYGDGWPVIAYMDTASPGHLYVIQDPPGLPEPATVALLALGGLAIIRRRRSGRRSFRR